jgi:competence protein ComEC
LIPAALVFTAGISADRYGTVPLPVSLLVAVLGLVAWAIFRNAKHRALPLIYLAIAVTALGAAYHHYRHDVYAPDDIGNFASPEPRLIRLRGVVVEEPIILHQVHRDPLQSMERPEDSDPTVGVLEVTRLKQAVGWVPVSGRAQLVVGDQALGCHVGDEIEVVGWLKTPSPPANPGETNHAAELQDRRIRAQVVVRKTREGVTRVGEGWPRSVRGWLGVIRTWGQRVLKDSLPRSTSGVAMALVLGEGSTMTQADWEKYRRTGVIHALAISGWHLEILAIFLWRILRTVRVRRRWGAVGVALFLLAYALLTGGRPPAMRAAVMACVACGGILLRRPVLSANSLALAWLIVAALNPADLFTGGCQLSFLAVAVLHWGFPDGGFFKRKLVPLEQLIEESRPSWLRLIHRGLRWLVSLYVLNLVIWLAAVPLVAFHYHLIPSIALLIAPVAVLFTMTALLTGFVLLCTVWVGGPIAWIFAGITHYALMGCESLVNLACWFPAGHWYVGDLSAWWVTIWYAGLLTVLVLEAVRRRLALAAVAGLGWLCVGLAVSWARPAGDELRCTFLAVGHGGCCVLETPDGRVLLYDAGAMNGPEVTHRQIAPFLWSRGIRRVDEVFLSHADLDHFNGLQALLERFAVGQVTHTPSFPDKQSPGVREILAAIERHRVPRRKLWAGDHLTAGSVDLDVLHPPADGPKGKENVRSMVLLIRHAGHALLLTGDLEGPGLERVVALPPPQVNILMAPHHGSRAGDAREVGNRTRLALVTRPEVIVSCQGLPRGSPLKPDPYQASGARFLGTWPHGAVIVRSQDQALVVETFQTGPQFILSTPR